MNTTLNIIRQYNPSTASWTKLLAHLNKQQPDDEPLSLMTILESNGIEDAVWALRCFDHKDYHADKISKEELRVAADAAYAVYTAAVDAAYADVNNKRNTERLLLNTLMELIK